MLNNVFTTLRCRFPVRLFINPICGGGGGGMWIGTVQQRMERV